MIARQEIHQIILQSFHIGMLRTLQRSRRSQTEQLDGTGIGRLGGRFHQVAGRDDEVCFLGDMLCDMPQHHAQGVSRHEFF